MEILRFEFYWQDIPTSSEQAVTYSELCHKWKICERQVRKILHALSTTDNGDDFVLIRSARNKGFYKTDDLQEIKAYKSECLNRAGSILGQVTKINRIMANNADQLTFENNLRVIRQLKGLKQAEVCEKLQEYDKGIDRAMLSKMENNVCLPTPYQTAILAKIYNVTPQELVKHNFYL